MPHHRTERSGSAGKYPGCRSRVSSKPAKEESHGAEGEGRQAFRPPSFFSGRWVGPLHAECPFKKWNLRSALINRGRSFICASPQMQPEIVSRVASKGCFD